MSKNVIIDGVEYAPAGPQGNRHVVVVDRGWIFAGDLTEENGRIKLDNAIMVMKWSLIGFDGMLRDPLSDKVKLKNLDQPVDIPAISEIFRVPVNDTWGMK